VCDQEKAFQIGIQWYLLFKNQLCVFVVLQIELINRESYRRRLFLEFGWMSQLCLCLSFRCFGTTHRETLNGIEQSMIEMGT